MSEEKDTKTAVTEASDEVREVYELGLLFKPTLSDQELPASVEEIKKSIEVKTGEVLSEGQPKMQALAYVMEIPYSVPREKYDHAYFGWIKFDLPKDQVKTLEQEISASKNFVRYLLIKTVRQDTTIQFEAIAEAEAEAEEVGPDGQVPKTSSDDNTPESVSKQVSEAKVEAEEVDQDEIDKNIEELIVN